MGTGQKGIDGNFKKPGIMNWEKNIAMRQSFGQKLLDLAGKVPEMVVLDADVSSSTQTIHFGKKYPERFFNVGVAEANLVDIAGGLATCGLRPVASTFAIFFALKATDQIRNNICYNNLPVILVGGYGGLSDSFDGASHQSITDIAIMRAMPNMKVLVPADGPECEYLLEEALQLNGPVYIRICRNETPVITDKNRQVPLGEIAVLNKGDDITLCACGITVPIALEAAEAIKSHGVSAEVLNVSSIKPLDSNTLIRSVRKTKRVITIEEHTIIGGLGSAVSECVVQNYPVKMDRIGISDIFTETGPYDSLLEKYGISSDNIMKKALELLKN
jgi:transketolase